MSIFDNVTFMNEAEVTKTGYLKDKQERAEAEKEAEYKNLAHRNERDIGYKTRRYDTITGKQTTSNFMAGYKKEDEDKMRKDYQNREKAANMVNREIERRNKDTSGKVRKIERDEDGYVTDRSHRDFTKAYDSALRYRRRHHNESAGIFESVEII